MFNLKIEIYLKFILLISLISLISAYYIEHVLGHQPCNLCLIERIPYLLSVILIIINYVLKKNERFLILILVLVFAFSLLISIYHFGIEKGFFEESSICGLKNAAEILSKDEILKQLNKKVVNCKDVTFKIFGFSLTVINIMLSLVLFILSTKIFINYEKFKK